MSEYTDATDEPEDEPREAVLDEGEPDEDGPQPWAKALPGNEDD